MSKIVGTILTSSVVAVICTGLFSLINNHINGIKKYAVEEKREWRKEIKNIGEELTITNNMYETRKILNKLKVRINPYGRGKKEDYLHDSHIWEIIKEIEDKPYENQAENKEKLLIYLSLLLQYDYEKTEKIIEGKYRIFNIITLLLMIAGSAFVIYMHFFKLKFEFNENLVSACVILTVIPFVGAMLHPIRFIQNKFREKKIKGICASIAVIFSIVGIISAIYSLFVYYNITLEYVRSNKDILKKIFVVLVVLLLFFIGKLWDADNVRIKYEDAVKQVYNERK